MYFFTIFTLAQNEPRSGTQIISVIGLNPAIDSGKDSVIGSDTPN